MRLSRKCESEIKRARDQAKGKEAEQEGRERGREGEREREIYICKQQRDIRFSGKSEFECETKYSGTLQQELLKPGVPYNLTNRSPLFEGGGRGPFASGAFYLDSI